MADTPRISASGTAQGRLALILVNVFRAGSGLPLIMWFGLDHRTQDHWFKAAGDMLGEVIKTDRLLELTDAVEGATEDPKVLADALRRLLS